MLMWLVYFSIWMVCIWLVLCICVSRFLMLWCFLVVSIVLLKVNSVLVDNCSGLVGIMIGVGGGGGVGGCRIVV